MLWLQQLFYAWLLVVVMADAASHSSDSKTQDALESVLAAAYIPPSNDSPDGKIARSASHK